jgi:hypothetical protein
MPRLAAVIAALTMVLLLPTLAQAVPVRVTINTPTLAGVHGQLAFDLIDGGDPHTIVDVSAFVSDGSLGSVTRNGAVAGDLTTHVQFFDNAFFNELLQEFVFGSAFSFVLDASTLPPGPNSFPDGFSLFLLDPATGNSLITTTDPTGANALFLWSSDAPSLISVFEGTGIDVAVTAVPEPDTLALFCVGAAMLALFHARRRRRRQGAGRLQCALATRRRSRLAPSWITVAMLAVSHIPVSTHAADVTATTSIKKSPLVLNRTSNTFDSIVTLTNTSATGYTAPLRLSVMVTPSIVSLANGTGTSSDGKSFIDIPLPGGTLNQGQSVSTIIKLRNLPRVAFNVAFSVDATTFGQGPLPPDPGPAGAIPLLGIDSDRDGIRDDVQRYIALTYPHDTNAVNGLRILSATYQEMLKVPAGSVAAAKTANDKAWRNRSCLVYLYGAREGHRRAKALFAEQFNTSARYKAWAAQDDLLGGQSFESPRNRSTTCDFTVAARP